MAYTIIRSDGNILTTIADGNLNSTSSSLGLPGRNYPGYGQTLDTNFVRIVENFANGSPPPNPLKGQLWFDTGNSQMRICPSDGTTNANNWAVITTTNTGLSANLGNLTVTGNISANNAAISENITCNSITGVTAVFSSNITVATANVTTGNIGTVRTQVITTGAAATTGTLTGSWTVTGSTTGNVFGIASGNIAFASSTYGIRCDNYMYANGESFSPTGTYTNGNVQAYLSGVWANGDPYVGTTFTGNIAPDQVTTNAIAGGGTISGIWTLASGARIQATYADLAERYEADAEYEPGTVVELGGEKEVTIATELSENVFGVVSRTAAYLMNSMAGDDDTHPAIALAGRLHVKAIGTIKKNDRLVSAGGGFARAAKPGELSPFNSIGRALSNKDSEEEGTVEAVVLVK
jgi:hypothetical protein